MSLEALVKEIEQSRMKEQERWMATMREQYRAIVRAKDEEIAALRDEIDTLRSWLDHSALPATNPISKRKDSTGLIKLNFGRDKPCPDMWKPGEKELLKSVKRNPKEPEPRTEAATAPEGALLQAPERLPPSPKPRNPAESISRAALKIRSKRRNPRKSK